MNILFLKYITAASHSFKRSPLRLVAYFNFTRNSRPLMSHGGKHGSAMGITHRFCHFSVPLSQMQDGQLASRSQLLILL